MNKKKLFFFIKTFFYTLLIVNGAFEILFVFGLRYKVFTPLITKFFAALFVFIFFIYFFYIYIKAWDITLDQCHVSLVELEYQFISDILLATNIILS